MSNDMLIISSNTTYCTDIESLRHCDDANVLGKTGAAVARPPEAGEDAAQALGADAPVDGMRGRRRSTRYPAMRFMELCE